MAKIDPQLWDPPEYLPISERQFLKDRAQTLHHIQQVAYLSMAQVLVQVQEHFKNDPKRDGWFWRWVDEATPLNKALAGRLLAIGKAVREQPELAELTRTYTHSCAAVVAKMPPKLRKQVITTLREHDELLTVEQIKQFTETPEAELESAELLVQKLQTTIAKAQIKVATATNAIDKRNATASVNASKDRLEVALQRLSEARAKVRDLEGERSTQEAVEAVLRAQIRAQQVQIEESNLDPDAKRKRALAKTVVDASNGLDLLLQSLDKFDVQKEELGEEAVRMLEKKMALVKSKLVKMSNAKT